jgi:hypothetical protein
MKKALTDSFIRTLRAPSSGRLEFNDAACRGLTLRNYNERHSHLEFPLQMSFITLALLATITAALAQNQTTFRDASGRTTGTATTDSQGTRTFRDASGRTTGTATFSNQGSVGSTTTFRDSDGRTTGTVSTPWQQRK